jgi:hypothetical protein
VQRLRPHMVGLNVQTFLPIPDLQQSALCLDWRRLGKQRVECLQILKALSDPSYGWRHHPAVRMWRGYDGALKQYANYCIEEWIKRGYRNTMALYEVGKVVYPPWFGGPIHDSHKSALLRKDPIWYGQFNWNVPALEYVWPV